MASGVFGISLMGLTAAKANMTTTSLNISNVNTAGYHRQTSTQVDITTGSAQNSAVGNGVSVIGASRAYSSFLDNQVLLSQGQLSNYSTYAQYATQLNSILGSQNSTLATSMSDFFSSVQDVANDPTSTVARQTMLSSGANLATQFDTVNSGITSIAQSVDQQVQSIAGQVTTYAQSIAKLNSQIAVVQASGGGSNANSLMDQRDALVGELNKLVNVSVVNQGGSGYNVYMGNGQPLVVGSQANSMVAVPNPTDSTQLQPALKIGNSTQPLDSSLLNGGELGGLLKFRDEMLVPTQRELGKLAYTVTTAMNNQSAMGYDLNGVQGTDFFTQPAVQNPIANLNNTGNGSLTLSITDPNLLANSDYKLSFDGTNYTVTRLSDGTSYSNASIAGLSATLQSNEGFSLTLDPATTINANDTYLIRPTQYSASGLAVAITSPSQIAAAAQGVTAFDNTATNTGTGTIGQPTLGSNVTRPIANAPFTLTYNGGGITVTDSSSTVLGSYTYTSGSPITFNGISVTITGVPNDGDSFIVNNSGVSAGPGDNGNALAMASLQTQKLLLNGSSTLQSTFTQLVGRNATLENSATTNQTAYKSLTDQATQAQQSYSGVNLDEEAANLIQYQQAYQAAAKAMQVAQSLFTDILSALQ